MARRRTPPESVRAKWVLADRLRTVRTELFGDRGLADFACRLGVPIRTWYSYESGVTVPAEVLLAFIELTAVDPHWLFHGTGSRYQAQPTGACAGDQSTPDPIAPRGSPAPLGQDIVRVPQDAGIERATPGFRTLRVEGVAMEPIVADGAFVTYADCQESPLDLEGKLIVAAVHSRPIVRWLSLSGDFGLLRAENPAHQPATELFDLKQPSDLAIWRVLWVGTPH